MSSTYGATWDRWQTPSCDAPLLWRRARCAGKFRYQGGVGERWAKPMCHASARGSGANGMIAPVAVIGPHVDLAVNDPIELCASVSSCAVALVMRAAPQRVAHHLIPRPHQRTTAAKRRAHTATPPAQSYSEV